MVYNEEGKYKVAQSRYVNKISLLCFVGKLTSSLPPGGRGTAIAVEGAHDIVA